MPSKNSLRIGAEETEIDENSDYIQEHRKRSWRRTDLEEEKSDVGLAWDTLRPSSVRL
jgi:hypothetical protein